MVFGRLTVLSEVTDRGKSKNVSWICKCECGKIKKIQGRNLVGGFSKSCGCNKDHQITHGKSKSKLYTVWRSMKSRCYYAKGSEYNNYGARGILVCDRWVNSFENFFEDMASSFQPGLQLERKDNQKGYSPYNCKWETVKNQQRNKRTNHLLTINNETMSLVEWEEKTGIKANTILTRIRRGWPIEKVLLEIANQ